MTVIFHLLFARHPSRRTAPLLEYTALAFGALGIISLSSDVRVWIANNQLSLAEQRAAFAFSDLRQFASDPPGVCVTLSRGQFYTPGEQEEYDTVCRWFHAVRDTLPARAEPGFSLLHLERTRAPMPINAVLKQTIEEFKGKVDWYELNRVELARLRNRAVKGPWEDFLFAMSPLLLCVAIALGITAVSAGERAR